MKQLRSLIGLAVVVSTTGMITSSCNNEKIAALPDPPASAKQVEAFLKGKNFSVKSVGFYGALTINDKTEMEWIDTTDAATKENKTTMDVMRELSKSALTFTNDTAATVTSNGQPYAATWVVDDQPKDDEPAGIRLRVSYADPSFSFGSEPMVVTYSYVVKGINEKQLLLELPRTINRRNLVAIME